VRDEFRGGRVAWQRDRFHRLAKCRKLVGELSPRTEILERWTDELPNLRVVWGRAEEQPSEVYGVAVAKALAQPPVAAEWCLPLVVEGGAVVLWVGPSADPGAVELVAGKLAGALEPAPPGFLLIRKTGPTPPGFPRRTGIARKRPLA